MRYPTRSRGQGSRDKRVFLRSRLEVVVRHLVSRGDTIVTLRKFVACELRTARILARSLVQRGFFVFFWGGVRVPEVNSSLPCSKNGRNMSVARRWTSQEPQPHKILAGQEGRASFALNATLTVQSLG